MQHGELNDEYTAGGNFLHCNYTLFLKVFQIRVWKLTFYLHKFQYVTQYVYLIHKTENDSSKALYHRTIFDTFIVKNVEKDIQEVR